MHVIEPKQIHQRHHKNAKIIQKKRRIRFVSAVIIIVAGVFIFSNISRPISKYKVIESKLNFPKTQNIDIPWPSFGQSAFGAVGYGLIESNGEQVQLPIASIAKTITAVAIIKVKPLNVGEKGENISITQNDEDTYYRYLDQGQSVVKVESGQIISEYQALQAMLIPSANNMSEILATWAFGSIDEYLVFVNQFVASLGMKNTTVADASGFDSGTKSTAADLTILAEIVMNNPVLADIVSQETAEIPVAGTIYNSNFNLGNNDLIGIKTGYTVEAGGCFMFAAKHNIDNENSVVIVGVIMGAQNSRQAINNSVTLINQITKGFSVAEIVSKNYIAGTIQKNNVNHTNLITKNSLSIVYWSGSTPVTKLNINNADKDYNSGDELGSLEIFIGNLVYNIPVVAENV